MHVFFPPLQAHWLGEQYFLRGSEGNDIHKTNVPNLRISFRYEVKNKIKLRHPIYVLFDLYFYFILMITVLVFIICC